MTTLREAAQQALDALEYGHFAVADQAPHAGVMAYLEATDKLREALAQPEPEPVAIVVAAEYEDGSHAGHRLEWRGRNEANDYPEGTEFYTQPPQRKPLTDEEMRALWENHGYKSALCMRFARAIERAHGIRSQE